MKQRVFSIIVLLLMLFTNPVDIYSQQNTASNVQNYIGTSTKFAIMVSDIPHFRAAIMTAEEMDVKKKGYKFEIVIVGELAKHLVEDPSLIDDISKSEKLGIKIVICENALKFFNAPIEKLDKRIKTTRNGWIYMFELKDKGFNTLSV